MFGTNPVEKAEFGSGTALRVVRSSPFLTIQGEGPFAGYPAVFVRLHGCNLRCYFCDTQFSDDDDPFVDVDELVEQVQAEAAKSPGCALVVLTGGEPMRQPVNPLVRALLNLSFTVQIETAGTLYRECMTWDGVTTVVSPKTARIDDRVFNLADVFKYVVSAEQQFDTDGLPITNTQDEHGRPVPLAKPRPGAAVYLSPMEEYHADGTPDTAKQATNARMVGQVAVLHGYRAGLQLHKYMGLA